HICEQTSEQVSEQEVNSNRTDDEQPTINIKNEKNDNNYRNNNARAHARHANGVSMDDDFASRMRPNYRENFCKMREQIQKGHLEFMAEEAEK
ncbi:MAG: hypothetical protein Q4B18_07910, partial [Bacillota bacterium]|nr:hypothetical protein [Bacillota bacterium]